MTKLKTIIISLVLAVSISSCCTGIVKTAKDYATTNRDAARVMAKMTDDIKCPENDAECKASLEMIKKLLADIEKAAQKIIDYKKKY